MNETDEKRETEELEALLKSLPEQITPPPGLAEPAERLTEELYGKKAEKKKKRKFSVKRHLIPSLAVLLVLLIPLCIGLPLMTTLDGDDNNYYYGNELTVQTVEGDVADYMAAHDVRGYYFDENELQSTFTAHFLKSDERLMYLYQETIFVTEAGVDAVALGVAFTDDRFQKFDRFEGLKQSEEVAGISVLYGTETSENEDSIIVRGKFSYEKVNYYLEVKTVSEEGVLERYVTDLFA